jgi:hypothetical protein
MGTWAVQQDDIFSNYLILNANILIGRFGLGMARSHPFGIRVIIPGFDHGVGHSLLLLYDARVSNGQKSKEFKGLGHYPSNTSISLF